MDVGTDCFRVGIIPHTGSHTTLLHRPIGYQCNLETDVVGKYIQKFLAKTTTVNQKQSKLTMDFLQMDFRCWKKAKGRHCIMRAYNTIEEALEELRQGKMILVTDNPERENEGDLICAAEFATTKMSILWQHMQKGLSVCR